MATIAYNKDFIGPVCPPVHFTTPQKCLFVQAVLLYVSLMFFD